jgi:hypothetical protein
MDELAEKLDIDPVELRRINDTTTRQAPTTGCGRVGRRGARSPVSRCSDTGPQDVVLSLTPGGLPYPVQRDWAAKGPIRHRVKDCAANGDSPCDKGIAASHLIEFNFAQQTIFIRLILVHAQSPVVCQADHSAIDAETFVTKHLPLT